MDQTRGLYCLQMKRVYFYAIPWIFIKMIGEVNDLTRVPAMHDFTQEQTEENKFKFNWNCFMHPLVVKKSRRKSTETLFLIKENIGRKKK